MASPDLSKKINGLPEPALLIDRAGMVVANNLHASRLLRLSSTKIVGKRLGALVSDGPEKLARYLRRCLRNSEGASGKLTILPVGGQAIVCRAVAGMLRPHRDQSRLLCLRLLPRDKVPLAKSDAHLRVGDEKRARRHADRRWRTAFESAAIGIVMVDFDGRYFGANMAFRDMLGYTEAELYRLRFDEVTYEEDRETNALLISELAEGKRQHFEIEKRYRRKDGTLLWARQHVALVPGMQGVAPFWFGVVENITERKRVEQELRLQQENFQESEARLQAFFENSPNVVFMKDREGRYLHVNREFKRVVRITQEEVMGKRDDELFSAEQAAAFQANDRHVLEAGVPMEFEETALEEDGQHTSIVHKFPLFNAEREIYAIGGIVTDITEREKSESALRFSEERYRVVVETASDAVISIDENGTILFANPATAAIFGYDPTELIGKPLTVLMPDDMRALFEKGFQAYFATGRRQIDPKGTELKGLRKNGQEFRVEVAFGDVTSSVQRVFTGFIRDISERKRAEEERDRLRRAEADLAHINRVSTMGQLTASLAHEIKQPIAAAVTDAKTCLRWLGRDRPEVVEAREAASRLIADVTRASDIISRIGSLFKKDVLRRELVDLNQVIQEMINLLRSEATKHSISIYSELAEALPPIMADRVQLQQVFMNLMLNGIEAMKNTKLPRKLAIKSQQNLREVLVLITDTGVGLRHEQTEKIFNPFFTSKPQGTGMGLPISRSIIESHGGRLWATSNSELGAIFQFTLPLEATKHLAA